MTNRNLCSRQRSLQVNSVTTRTLDCLSGTMETSSPNGLARSSKQRIFTDGQSVLETKALGLISACYLSVNLRGKRTPRKPSVGRSELATKRRIAILELWLLPSLAVSPTRSKFTETR